MNLRFELLAESANKYCRDWANTNGLQRLVIADQPNHQASTFHFPINND